MSTSPMRSSAPAPKRKATLPALLVALLVVAGAAGIAGAPRPAGAAETPQRDPVIFVHGLYGSPSNFTTMRIRFLFSGYWGTPMVGFGYNSLGSMTTAAQQLGDEVDRVLAESGADRVDIVTHSLGGLPSRHFVKFLGGTEQVDDWVSLGGPNQGGDPGTCPAPGSVACVDATRGSPFVTALNSGDQTPGDVTYTTYASPCDTVVDPSWTPVEGGTHHTLGCISHFSLVSNATVIQNVVQVLNS
jgi:triacylglycerol lipase